MLDHEAPRYIPLSGNDVDENAALERIRTELDREPPPEAIKRKDGFDYLHGYYVLARANQIFGALNISYRHIRSAVLHTGTAHTRSGERCYVVCEATAGVQIALPGDRTFYTEGTATCDGIGRAYGDAFTIAQKGAYTDARKIALRPLGKTFGSLFSMVDDPSVESLESLDADGMPEPKPAPTKQTSTAGTGKATGAEKPLLDPAVDGWWKEIRNAQSSLGWTRKRLADFIKEQTATPAASLTPEQLSGIYAKLVGQIEARMEIEK
jgi:hypothetical protein